MPLGVEHPPTSRRGFMKSRADFVLIADLAVIAFSD